MSIRRPPSGPTRRRRRSISVGWRAGAEVAGSGHRGRESARGEQLATSHPWSRFRSGVSGQDKYTLSLSDPVRTVAGRSRPERTLSGRELRVRTSRTPGKGVRQARAAACVPECTARARSNARRTPAYAKVEYMRNDYPESRALGREKTLRDRIVRERIEAMARLRRRTVHSGTPCTVRPRIVLSSKQLGCTDSPRRFFRGCSG